MGASESEPFNEELAGYKVIHRVPENNITHLSHIETDKEYLLREHTFNEDNMYKKVYNEHKQRQAISDDHLTHLGRVQGKQIDHLCSNIYKIYAIWEYPYRFLSDEISQRSYQNRKFEDKQIWSILASAILGLSTLQKNKIKHEMITTKTILLDSEGLIKIADPLACGTASNMDTIYRNRNTQGIYLSPQQCQTLQARGAYNNAYKNDVWTIGMILLECGLLKSMSDCYKDEFQRIDYNLVHRNLAEFGNQYGEDLKIIVQLMLKKDNKDRPDWIDLQPYARKNKSNHQNTNNNNYTNANISLSPLSNQDQQSSFSPYIPISNNKPSSKKPNDFKQPSYQSKDSFRNQQIGTPIVFNNQSFNHPNQTPSMAQSYGYGFSTTQNINTVQNSIQTPKFPIANSIPISQTSSLTSSLPYNAVTTPSFTFQPLYRPTEYSTSDRVSSINRGHLFPSPPPATEFKKYDNWKTSAPYQSNIPLNTNITTSIPYTASRPDTLKPDYLKSDFTTTINQPPSYVKNDYTRIDLPKTTDNFSTNFGINKFNSNYLGQTGGLSDNKLSPYSNNSYNYNSNFGTNKYSQLYTPPSLLNSVNKPFQSINSNTNTYINPVPSLNLNSVTNPISSVTNKYNTAPTPISTANNLTHNQQPDQNKLINNYSNPNSNKTTNTKPVLQSYNPSTWSSSYNTNNMRQNNFRYYGNSPQKQQKIQSVPAQNSNNRYQPVINQNIGNQNVDASSPQNKIIYLDDIKDQEEYVQRPDFGGKDQRNNQNPEFVIQTFRQGSKYEGFKLRDMRHGQGKFYYQDGGMYDGNWTENKMDGYGSLYYQSGELAYQGMWKDDQFQGKGKLFNQTPEQLNEKFNYQNFDEIDQCWQYYEGQFVQDFKKGKGKLMLSNGEYFQGTFNNDMVQGPGTFYCRDGQIIKGVWKQNHLISR